MNNDSADGVQSLKPSFSAHEASLGSISRYRYYDWWHFTPGQHCWHFKRAVTVCVLVWGSSQSRCLSVCSNMVIFINIAQSKNQARAVIMGLFNIQLHPTVIINWIFVYPHRNPEPSCWQQGPVLGFIITGSYDNAKCSLLLPHWWGSNPSTETWNCNNLIIS